MRVIETARLLIRSFTPEDLKPLYELILWYNASPYAAYDHPWPASEAEIREICRWFSSADAYFAVCLKENGRLIGFVSLNPTECPGVLNLGYCFHGDSHGHGYAFESCRAVIEQAFKDKKAEKLETGTARDNVPSCRLLERLGFTLVRSEPAAFRQDENGSPLVFTANIYELNHKPRE